MSCFSSEAVDSAPAQRADANVGGHDCDADLDQPMDSDEERDFADQDPLSDMDIEEDAQILATVLRHVPFCMNADVFQHV